MAQDTDLLAFPQQPSDRLRLALRQLEQALAEQAEAMAEFRATMGELKGTVGGLADSVTGYQETLGELQRNCDGANEAARHAEAVADALFARLH